MAQAETEQHFLLLVAGPVGVLVIIQYLAPLHLRAAAAAQTMTRLVITAALAVVAVPLAQHLVPEVVAILRLYHRHKEIMAVQMAHKHLHTHLVEAAAQAQ